MSASFPSLSHSHSAFPLPQVPEDTLHYTIHLPTSYSDPSATALLINQYVHTLLRHPWLWNKDSWELKVADFDSERSSEGPKLEGRMRVGDAVDDEWLVVWLLREVSRKWPELIISIRDTDGEFLLIEAANELPSWVSPDNADNRLWLQGAHLHLIPLSVRSAAAPHQLSDDMDSDPAIHLSESDALRAVRTGKYPASKAVEQAVWQRIAGYPDAMRTHLHRTNIYLPLAVAKALRQQPDLVQKAVEAFYVRDPAQLRAASRMTHFPPSPAVLTDITLTRAAYAQLQGQVFHAPRVFGPEWHVGDGADQGSESSPEKLDDQRRWRDLGVKVATGFEIMYREGGKSSRTGAQASNEVTQGPEYQTFLADLKRSGWFGEELEGSQKWKEREEEARKGYAEVKSADVASQRPSFAYLVDNAVSSSTLSPEDLTASADTPEDDDKWLEVSPDELDGLMLRASGQDGTKGAPGNKERMEVGEEHGQMLGDLAKKVQDFVGGQGDMQGARFLDELSDEDMMDSGSDSEEDEELQAHKKQLESEKQSRLSNLVPNLAAEDWGHKTSKPPAPKPNTEPAAAAQPTQTEKKANPLDFIPSTMRPPRFAKQEFDGVVSDSDDDDEDDGQLPAEGTWGRKIAQMKWGDFPPVDGEDDDGVAKIEEIEEDEDEQGRKEKLVLEDEALEEQMKRRVWGEDEAEEDEDDEMPEDIEDVEMEGEGDETQKFLDFSREALGISDEIWEGILQERKDRGSFVPELKKKEKIAAKEENRNFEDKPIKAGQGKKVQFSEEKVKVAPEPGQPNASLDSFDSVMRAMDEALAQSRPSAPAPAPIPGSKAPKKSKSKVSSANPLPPAPPGEDIDFDNFDEDDLLAMDRELRSVLVGAGVDPDALSDDDDDPEEVGMLDGEGRNEYEMMKNFLESWKSQGGESGAVGNLFGRLAQDKK